MLQVPPPKIKKIFVDVEWRTNKNAVSTNAGREWLKYIKECKSTLDYGGGNRLTHTALKNLGYIGSYEVCDQAEDVGAEFNDIDKIDKKYDLVTCFQVIEHMYFEDFLDFIPKLLDKIKPGGWLAIGSDHPMNSGHLWNVELGHVKAYPFLNLHQYLSTLGMNKNNSNVILQYVTSNSLKNRILYYVRKFFGKILGIDPYHSYIIFIQKENSPENSNHK